MRKRRVCTGRYYIELRYRHRGPPNHHDDFADRVAGPATEACSARSCRLRWQRQLANHGVTVCAAVKFLGQPSCWRRETVSKVSLKWPRGVLTFALPAEYRGAEEALHKTNIKDPCHLTGHIRLGSRAPVSCSERDRPLCTASCNLASQERRIDDGEGGISQLN